MDSSQPPYLHPDYKSTLARAPRNAPVPAPASIGFVTGPSFANAWTSADGADLTCARGGEAQGQRIIVTGRVLDDRGMPLRRTLIEVWQANAAGRYHHDADQHDAPLDPHFTGAGALLTDDEGGYRFLSVRPGAYPWRNHYNAWRPAHIHFSVFGAGFASRLITQMYFPGDPLLALDPIYNSIPDAAARERLVSQYDHSVSEPEYALGYRFDLVLAGGRATPMERSA